MSRGAFHPDPKNGIRHFGELLPVEISSETPNIAAKIAEIESEKKAFIDMNIAFMGAESTKMKKVLLGSDTNVSEASGAMNFEGISAADIEVTMDNYSLLNAVATAIQGLWAGWDQNIFARNSTLDTRS